MSSDKAIQFVWHYGGDECVEQSAKQQSMNSFFSRNWQKGQGDMDASEDHIIPGSVVVTRKPFSQKVLECCWSYSQYNQRLLFSLGPFGRSPMETTRYCSWPATLHTAILYTVLGGCMYGVTGTIHIFLLLKKNKKKTYLRYLWAKIMPSTTWHHLLNCNKCRTLRTFPLLWFPYSTEI